MESTVFNTNQTAAHIAAFSRASVAGMRTHMEYDHKFTNLQDAGQETIVIVHATCHMLEEKHNKLHAHLRNPAHTCHIGPLCEIASSIEADYPRCSHRSCADLIMERCNACMYEALDGARQADPIMCGKHGWTYIIDAGSNSGFAGEGVWWENYACGDGNMEQGHYTDN